MLQSRLSGPPRLDTIVIWPPTKFDMPTHDNFSHLAFLEPVHHYIRAIFSAKTPTAQAAAFSNAGAYIASCLQDNRSAAQQLRAERLRLSQECQVPPHYSRHCRLVCSRNQPQQQKPHQLVITDINAALHVLDIEERLLNNWKVTFAPVPSVATTTPPGWLPSPVQHVPAHSGPVAHTYTAGLPGHHSQSQVQPVVFVTTSPPAPPSLPSHHAQHPATELGL